MPEYIKEIDQGTDEWHELRLGSVGGTAINSVLSKGQGKMRQSLLYHLAAEILSGKKTNSFQSAAMLRGKELEGEARQAYCFITGNDVEQVALVKGDMPRVHVSPDGLVGDDGGIEIKVLEPHVYVELVDTGKIDIKYIRQCQYFLWLTGRQWIDFAAYCPEIEKRPLWINRLAPDAKVFGEIDSALPPFMAELDGLVQRLLA